MSYKILIADDASFVRLMIHELLVHFGHTDILEAKNGSEAIAIYKANMPALTILDITMPELDGLSALREIIAFDPTAKIIMCSAVAHDNVVHEALDLGALDFIAKPFRPDEFENIIANYLSSN